MGARGSGSGNGRGSGAGAGAGTAPLAGEAVRSMAGWRSAAGVALAVYGRWWCVGGATYVDTATGMPRCEATWCDTRPAGAAATGTDSGRGSGAGAAGRAATDATGTA